MSQTDDTKQTGTTKPATTKPDDANQADEAAKSATNEAERHKTGALPAKAGKVKPTA